METIELIKDVCLFGGNLPNNRVEEVRAFLDKAQSTVCVSDVHSFLEWLNNQKKDYMGGEFLYDIKGHYKRLKHGEMFDYWLTSVHEK